MSGLPDTCCADRSVRAVGCHHAPTIRKHEELRNKPNPKIGHQFRINNLAPVVGSVSASPNPRRWEVT